MEAVAAKQVVCSILVFFSWSHSNIGDIGITPGMIRLLEENMPGVEVTICANSRAEATREYLTSRFPKCKVVATPFRAAKLTPEFREAFDRADLILYNSGTTLSYGRWERNWNRTMPLAMPLVMAREAGKPYGIYCQSFERFQWPSDVMFRPLLSDAAFVFVRDGNSLEYLKSVGIAPPIMEYGPDATFAFDLRDEAAADEFMKRHDLEPRKFITLTVRTSGQGFIDEKREQVHAVKMRGLVETWVRKTGLDVLICPEVKFEIEPARRLIYDPLPADVRKHVRIKESFWLPDEAFSVYGRAHTIVSMEMHSIILGLAAGTPSIHPRFVEAGRKAWMLRDLGVEEWLFDLDEDPADEITSSLLKIHDDYDAALGKVERAMDFVHKRQKETMDVVKRTAQNARKR
jgi:polysaccharide pyruvyl transferase WcaK-like protein